MHATRGRRGETDGSAAGRPAGCTRRAVVRAGAAALCALALPAGTRRALAGVASASTPPAGTGASRGADPDAGAIGVSPTTLWGGQVPWTQYPPACLVETNLGDVVCEAYLRAANAAIVGDADLVRAWGDAPLVALERGGNVRGQLDRGLLADADLRAVMAPSSGDVSVVAVTPRALVATLEAALATIVAQDPATGMLDGMPSGDTPQLAGLAVTYDPSLPAGVRVTCVALERSPAEALDPTDDETRLLLATSSYPLSGAAPYGALAGAVPVCPVGAAADVVDAYLRDLMLVGDAGRDPSVTRATAGASRAHDAAADASGGDAAVSGAGDVADVAAEGDLGALPVIAGTKERLRPEGAYVPRPWVATLRVCGADGAPCANARVGVRVDGGDALWATTDGDGLLALELPDGPHAVCLVREVEGAPRASEAGDIQDEAQDETEGSASPDARDGIADAAGEDGVVIVSPSTAGEQTRSDRVRAAATVVGEVRARGHAAPEAYVSNYLGIGLVEDDVRTYPTLVWDA